MTIMVRGILTSLFLLVPIGMMAQPGFFPTSTLRCSAFYAQNELRLDAAVGYDSGVYYYRSEDGGAHWNTTKIEGETYRDIHAYEIRAVLFTDSAHGMLAGSRKTSRSIWYTEPLLLLTSDAGQTWTTPTGGHPYYPDYQLIHISVTSSGMIVFTGGEGYDNNGPGHFLDGRPGIAKLRANSTNLEWIDSLSRVAYPIGVPDGSHGRIHTDFSDSLNGFWTAISWCGGDSIAFLTRDGGHSWMRMDSILTVSNNPLNLTTLWFGRDSILFGSNNDQNFRSTNLGLDWAPIDSHLPLRPHLLSFRGNVVYSEADSSLYYSTDTGKTWDSVGRIDPDLTDLQAVDDSVAYALIRDTLYKTRSHGLKSSVRIPATLSSNVTMFPNPANEYVTIPISGGSIAIMDDLGREYYCPATTVESGLRLNISQLPSGHYTVRSGSFRQNLLIQR